MSCERKDTCRNYDNRCLFCDMYSQYKPYKQVKGLRSKPSSNNEGMDFEDKVVYVSNKYMAQRMPRSGGIDGWEGDVDFFITLLECKERDEMLGADKSISIKKKWLEKIEDEAGKNGKLPALAFRFKSSPEDLYFAMKYEYLLDLLYKVKTLEEELKKTKGENKTND